MAKKKEKLVCAICGKVLKEDAYGVIKDLYKLSDADICTSCAEEIRVMYPLSYKPNPDFDIKYYTKKNRWTGEYEEYTRETGGPRYFVTDGIEKLTLEEFKEKYEGVEAYKAELKRKYNGYNKIFEVTGGFEIEGLGALDVGIPRLLKFRGAMCFCGRFVLGHWRKNEVITLILEGKEITAKILCLGEKFDCNLDGLAGSFNRKEYSILRSANSLSDFAREGRAGYIVLEKGTPLPTVGNLIVTD